MKNPDLMDALQALATDKGITVDTLFGALADALESAYKRMPDAQEYAWVTIDPDTGEIRVIAQDSTRTASPSAPSSTSPPTTSAASPRRPPSRSWCSASARPSGR